MHAQRDAPEPSMEDASALRSAWIATRCSPAQKADFAALAAAKGMTESALLGALITTVLARNANSALEVSCAVDSANAAGARMTLRLRPGDRALADAFAARRHMKTSTYLVTLIRSHLRSQALAPMPELNELKAAVGVLSAANRGLQRLTLETTAAGTTSGLPPAITQLAASVESLRQAFSEFVRANLASWEAGSDRS
jgi:hypothetical protein